MGAKTSIRVHLDVYENDTCDFAIEQSRGTHGQWEAVASGTVHGGIENGIESVNRVLWELDEWGLGE